MRKRDKEREGERGAMSLSNDDTLSQPLTMRQYKRSS